MRTIAKTKTLSKIASVIITHDLIISRNHSKWRFSSQNMSNVLVLLIALVILLRPERLQMLESPIP